MFTLGHGSRGARGATSLLHNHTHTLPHTRARAGFCLGHGSLHSLASPRRVLGGWVAAGEGVRALAVSDACTAAVTSEGRLYTWGSGRSGQLGHGDVLPAPAPRLVRGLGWPRVRVVAVSAGPHHTGAVAADGRLYCWGDGQVRVGVCVCVCGGGEGRARALVG